MGKESCHQAVEASSSSSSSSSNTGIPPLKQLHSDLTTRQENMKHLMSTTGLIYSLCCDEPRRPSEANDGALSVCGCIGLCVGVLWSLMMLASMAFWLVGWLTGWSSGDGVGGSSVNGYEFNCRGGS